jgi:hypothetical protein
LGIIRIDSFLQGSMFAPNIFSKVIFVSNDYIERRKLKKYFITGLLKSAD